MKQLLSHYQAVSSPSTHSLIVDEESLSNSFELIYTNSLDIFTALDVLISHRIRDKTELNKKYQYLFDEELIETLGSDIWFRLEFINDDHLLPTANPNVLGLKLSTGGKEIIVYYDDEFSLNIGYNKTLYKYEKTGVALDDSESLFYFIVESAFPDLVIYKHITINELA